MSRKAPRASACNAVVGTLNNVTQAEYELVRTEFAAQQPFYNRLQYAVFQCEKGVNGGTFHLQAYFKLKEGDRIRFTGRDWVDCWNVTNGRNRWHWEAARGSPGANREYCTKQSTRATLHDWVEHFGTGPADDSHIGDLVGPFEYGTCPVGGGQGKRNDLHEFTSLVAAGASDRVLAEMFPIQYLKFGAHAGRLRAALAPPPMTREVLADGGPKMPIVIIFQGETGQGKSHAAWEEALRDHGPDEVYLSARTAKLEWEDALDPLRHKVLIFDEYEAVHKYREMLKICDKWPAVFPRRGQASVLWHPEKIIFTSTKSWRTWWSAAETASGEFARRINQVRVINQQRVVEVRKGPFDPDGAPQGGTIFPEVEGGGGGGGGGGGVGTEVVVVLDTTSDELPIPRRAGAFDAGRPVDRPHIDPDDLFGSLTQGLNW